MKVKDWIVWGLLLTLVVSFAVAQESTDEEETIEKVPCDMNWKMSHRNSPSGTSMTFIYQPCTGKTYRIYGYVAHDVVFPDPGMN